MDLEYHRVGDCNAMKTSELDRVKATQRAIKKAMIDKDILRVLGVRK